MSPYITYRDTDRNGILQYYILQKDFPHYQGIISSHPVNKTFFQIGIPGYNLWIVFAGCLRGNMIPAYQDAFEEIKIVFVQMTEWYLRNRILTNEKKYKKWKFTPHSTT